MALLSSSTISAYRTRVRDLHNQLRRQRNGRTMLELRSDLNSTAQYWANKMASQRSMYHSNVYCNACDRSCGENVAGNWNSPDSVVLTGWRNSCRHYYNMVNGGYNRMGVGVQRASNGALYWAVHFCGPSTYCRALNVTCPDNCGFCCACASCTNWKSNDPWKP